MQFSESWLRTLCNPSLSSDALCHALTMAGLEVEETRPVSPKFEKVVVAQVLSVTKHPDADRLNVCQIDAGQGSTLQIVCGAPNVAVAMKVPCALVGAALPGVTIKQAKVRGVDSHGMLCSAKELGLSEASDGLLPLPEEAPVGQDIRQYLDLDDTLITLKLTPNRADCLSLIGIARELAALTASPFVLPKEEAIEASHTEGRQIKLDAPDACPRYCGRIIRDVDAAAATPDWMKQRIERSGVRSISALVDITNYVMLELGQPLHAFDDAKLYGDIHVRYAKPDESLTLLNEQTVRLSDDILVIADETRALALAGIMGGSESAISTTTRDVFLESAFFAPAVIAGKARGLGFSSDASHRFERGVDFDLARRAIDRATKLILEVCGGNAGPITETISLDHLPSRKAVTLRLPRLEKILGVHLSAEKVQSIFASLQFSISSQTTAITVTPPSFRFDIEIEEDLVEEVARLHGYDNIPSNAPVARNAMRPASEHSRTPMQLRRLLAARNYQEVVTYSFVDAQWEKDFALGSAAVNAVTLANPIASQMSVMRTTLLGGLISVLAANKKRSIDRVRIFEVGRCFLQKRSNSDPSRFEQPLRLGGLAYGSALPEQWGTPTRQTDFYDLKGDIESLWSEATRLTFVPGNHPALHPGRSASIQIGNDTIGFLGELHPRLTQAYGLQKSPIIFELEVAALLQSSLPSYREVSRYPTVVRDLALIIDQKQSMAEVIHALKMNADTIVRDIKLFDVYQGKGLDESKKSLAFRIVMQDTQRTLEDAEIEVAIQHLVEIAGREFNATLRV